MRILAVSDTESTALWDHYNSKMCIRDSNTTNPRASISTGKFRCSRCRIAAAIGSRQIARFPTKIIFSILSKLPPLVKRTFAIRFRYLLMNAVALLILRSDYKLLSILQSPDVRLPSADGS